MHRFLRAFWITIGREFHSIDRLRLDKYMFLIRCYVGVAFEVFLKGKQNVDVDVDGSGKKRKRVEAEAAAAAPTKGGKRSKGKKQAEEQRFNDTTNDAEDNAEDDDAESTKWSNLAAYLTIIEEGPLNPLNFDPDQPSDINEKTDYVPMPHGPDGLRYHIMDLWLDELEKVLEFEDDDENGDKDGGNSGPKFASRKPKGDVPMDLLLRPIETLRVKGLHKPVRTRAGQALDDDRLVEWGVKERETPGGDDEDEDEDEDEEEWGGFGDE